MTVSNCGEIQNYIKKPFSLLTGNPLLLDSNQWIAKDAERHSNLSQGQSRSQNAVVAGTCLTRERKKKKHIGNGIEENVGKSRCHANEIKNATLYTFFSCARFVILYVMSQLYVVFIIIFSSDFLELYPLLIMNNGCIISRQMLTVVWHLIFSRPAYDQVALIQLEGLVAITVKVIAQSLRFK